MAHQEQQAQTKPPAQLGDVLSQQIRQPQRIDRQTQTSGITHLAVITGILLPFALVPYLGLRKQLLSLHRTVNNIEATSSALQRELKITLIESAVRKEEHARLSASLQDMKQEIARMRDEAAMRERARAASNNATRAQIQELLDDRQRTRAQISTLQELGMSLADVATFMHEVEMKTGWFSRGSDGRGLRDRIWEYASKFHALQPQNKSEKGTTKPKEDAVTDGGPKDPNI